MEMGTATFQESASGRLARIFPGATAMRIPVRLERGCGSAERTTIEYGTAQEVIFRTDTDLGFDESVRLLNDDGSFDVEARVIAVQWIDSRQAVAVRFMTPVTNWVVKDWTMKR